MKKVELANLKTGDRILNTKDNTVYVVTNVNEKVELDNGKAYSLSTIKRWFDLTPVEEKPVAVEDKPIQPTTNTVDTVDSNNTTNIVETGIEADRSAKCKLLTWGYIMKLCEDNNLQLMHHQDHSSIKYNKKNLVELSYSKRKGHFRILVRQDCLTSGQQASLIAYNDAKMVGNGTFTLDFQFVTIDYYTFVEVLKNALDFQLNKVNVKKALA